MCSGDVKLFKFIRFHYSKALARDPNFDDVSSHSVCITYYALVVLFCPFCLQYLDKIGAEQFGLSYAAAAVIASRSGSGGGEEGGLFDLLGDSGGFIRETA